VEMGERRIAEAAGAEEDRRGGREEVSPDELGTTVGRPIAVAVVARS
jgi:hypothetical protein